MKSLSITIRFSYTKDWSLGLGYLGSPKYEVTVVNSDGMGKIYNDLPTTTNSQTQSFSFSMSIADLKDTRLVLTFSTDNIQNLIHFKNIKINYRCYQ